MESFINVVVSNTVVAALLAMVAVIVTRVWRNPHFAHALWLLVLIKLVTPPIVTISLPQHWLQVATGGPRTGVIASDTEPSAPANGLVTPTLRPGHGELVKELTPLDPFVNPFAQRGSEIESSLESEFSEPTLEINSSAEPILPKPGETLIAEAAPVGAIEKLRLGRAMQSTAVPSPAINPIVVEATRDASHLPNWRAIMLIGWLVGAIAYAGILVCRCIRFRKVLVSANEATGTLHADAARFANLLGLRRAPIIRVVEARVPPLVWSIGLRPLVLLPKSLLCELDRAQQHTVLVHELAHIRRRDYCVRWLEAAVFVVFWWNPIAWFARKRLRNAEEKCCDAWVVWALPENRLSYGQALMKTIEFLTENPKALVLAGSTFGRFLFKRRIEMILKRKMSRRMSWLVCAVALTVAVIVLPVAAQTSGNGVAQNKTTTVAPPTKTREPPLPTKVKIERLPPEEPETVAPPATVEPIRAVTAPIVLDRLLTPIEAPATPAGSRAIRDQSFEKRLQRLEAVVKRLEKLLTATTVKRAATPRVRETPYTPLKSYTKQSRSIATEEYKRGWQYSGGTTSPKSSGKIRGATISKDAKLIVILTSDDKYCELNAIDSASGRQLWRTQLTAASADRLGFSDDGKSIQVYSGTKLLVKVAVATGRAEAEGFTVKNKPRVSGFWSDSVKSKEAPAVDSEDLKARELLLKLDVQASLLKIEAAHIKLKQLQTANAAESDIAHAKLVVKQAELDLRRAETILKLNHKPRPAPTTRSRR